MKIVMTLKVRDEQDILADNLRFHLAQGVDFFVITDNGSTDSTPEILERFQSAGLADVTSEPGEDFHDLGQEWVTRMARAAAAQHGADWVVHGDADEFWWPLEGTLREALDAVPGEYGALIGARAEYVARPPAPGHWSERLVVRERRALLRPKIAHRGDPHVIVMHRGGHDAAFVGAGETLRSALRPPGRAVLRGVRDEEGAGGGDPIPWPRFGVCILHFPMRSLEQFQRRIEAALLHDPGRGPRARLKERYESEGVEGLYADLYLDDAAVAAGEEAGRLVRDTRLRDFLAICPDPLDPGAAEATPPRPPSLPAEELERERRELERDAMEALTRHARLIEARIGDDEDADARLLRELDEVKTEKRRESKKARRRRERIRKLQRRLERQGEALRRERMRPGNRARRALGRALGRDRRTK
jgi:glycosyl transferase family 2